MAGRNYLEELIIRSKPICCEKCGCSVRNGRYCNFCVRELAGGIHSLIKSSMARNAIPQYSMTGRMRYVSCRK